MNQSRFAVFFAFLAAALYALNSPISKLLLENVPPTMMASFLYLGAGLGMLLVSLFKKVTHRRRTEMHLTKKDLPYTLGMIVLDILAPIFLMLGLSRTTPENASLLNNFEIVATSLIALLVFKEKISKRLWAAIGLIIVSSILLSVEDVKSFQFSVGSVFVLLACCCWGLENNCTRMLSAKSSVQITTIKGIFSGLGSLIVALVVGETLPGLLWIGCVLLLGFVAYGLSINFYIKAQKDLGAAKTSAYYSVAPFLGVVFGMLVLGERPALQFYLGLAIMVIATVLMVRDTIALQHTHEHAHVHTHAHQHGTLVHTHEHEHKHAHTHVHGENESAHDHTHESIREHTHTHEGIIA